LSARPSIGLVNAAHSNAARLRLTDTCAIRRFRTSSGCFVLASDTDEIAGFYALAATSVAFDSLPAALSKKLPRYRALPAMLIGWLAVANKHQGKGLGHALIADATIRTSQFGIGAFALIVDAKDAAAAAFYRKSGFMSIPDEERRMFLPIATALQAMAAAADREERS
jgi:GNAT superfamily N-acetyltransferase